MGDLTVNGIFRVIETPNHGPLAVSLDAHDVAHATAAECFGVDHV